MTDIFCSPQEKMQVAHSVNNDSTQKMHKNRNINSYVSATHLNRLFIKGKWL